MEASSAATPARKLEKLDYGTRLLVVGPTLATKSQSVLTPLASVPILGLQRATWAARASSSARTRQPNARRHSRRDRR